MIRAMLISLHPKPVLNIVDGLKKWEVRTWKLPEDVWIYGYVTKGNPRIAKFPKGYKMMDKPKLGIEINGKIPIRFRVGEIKDFTYIDAFIIKADGTYEEARNGEMMYPIQSGIIAESCLSYDELEAYGKGKTLYFHEIKDLQFLVEPSELSEFYTYKKKTIYSGLDCPPYTDEVKVKITKAPQKCQWVWR